MADSGSRPSGPFRAKHARQPENKKEPINSAQDRLRPSPEPGRGYPCRPLSITARQIRTPKPHIELAFMPMWGRDGNLVE